jgi:Domain of unknown function (DUF5666)
MGRGPTRREEGWAVTDEIEMLRVFRDEMPGPSAGAWARARSAIAAARSEEEQYGHQRGRGPGRRRLLVIAVAAAGILAIGGASYGLTAGLGGSGPPAGAPKANGSRGTGAGLTAVSGCPGLEATSGTLDRVNGASLVLKTAGAAAVTVTASASTNVARQVTGSISDVADGAQVIVHGTGSDGTIAAQNISIAVLPKLPGPPHHGHRRGLIRTGRGAVGQGGIAIGTVADASTGSFTVVMPGGLRAPVTTSGSTTVLTLASASLSQLQAGDLVVAVGSAAPDGALAAATIEQGTQLPQVIPRGNGIAKLPRLGCSPSAVATAALPPAG